jgi:hypothetical protein
MNINFSKLLQKKKNLGDKNAQNLVYEQALS